MTRTHGLASTYRGGCRCDGCRTANTVRARLERARRAASTPPAGAHGKAATYSNWRCRCEPCRAAHALYLATRRTPQRRDRQMAARGAP